MKKIILGLGMALILLITHVWGEGEAKRIRIYDVSAQMEIRMAEALPSLTKKRLIIVCEHHNNEAHHRAQLLTIKALHEANIPIAVGLEMFRRDSQSALDGWVNGTLPEDDFMRVYYDNWNFAWPYYSSIFQYAKKEKLPLVGLNVSRSVTRKVAQSGFNSLSESEKADLAEVTCRVDRKYMNFIKQAYGAHGHGDMNFIYFCEAQMLWDTVMAVTALKYLKANPGVTMVLLTGTGHAWKQGIPYQIRERADIPVAVLLPEVPERIEPGKIGSDDTDYIILKNGL
jgi:uncharacterized iron-regulated protein